LQFIDSRGRQQVVYATMHDPGLWEVRGTVSGQPFARQCHGWQAVERTVVWLRRHAHEPAPTPQRSFGPVAAAIGLMMLLGGSAVAMAQSQPPPSPAIQGFVDATREYAMLHRRLEKNLPTLEVTSNAETIYRAVQAMTDAVRAARPNARPGDIFTESVAVELRAVIADALAAEGFVAEDVLAAEAADGIDGAMAPLTVNGRFPWKFASGMFPCVLQALPPLPPELHYRIVGSTLVLIDVHADLIVDVLPYALVTTER
jgi:hypothetical protein